MPQRIIHQLGYISSLLAFCVTLAHPTVALAATTTVGLWPFNEVSGIVAHDISGNRNNGRIGSGITIGQTGHFSNSFKLNSGHITVPSAASLNPGGRSFHYTIWFKTITAPAPKRDYDLFRKGLSSSGGGDYKAEIIVDAHGMTRASCGFMSKTGYAYEVISTNTTTVTNGAWHSLTCRKTTTAISLNLDGVSVTQPAQITTISNTAPLAIGAKDTAGGDQYIGFLDQVGLYFD